MGLDMYLKAGIYLSAYTDNGADKKRRDAAIKLSGIPKELTDDSGVELSIVVCYWRKANAIHNWFVHNVQNGNDDCKSYCVDAEQLVTLQDLCLEALKTRDASLLPPCEGFFFGSTEIDDGYWDDLKRTAERLDKILKEPSLARVDFQYQSSW